MDAVTARYRSLVLLTEGRVVGDFVDPALVVGRLGIGTHFARGGIYEFCPRGVLEGVVSGTQRTRQTRRCVGAGGCVAVTRSEIGRVVERLPGELDELALINQIVVGNGTRRNAERCLERHLGVAVTASLGIDHDDTVGTAGSIEGAGRGVLEHGDRLDVLGVDRADRTRVGDTVHDIERRGAGVERTEAADGDRGVRTGLSGSGGGLHAGHLTFKGL